MGDQTGARTFAHDTTGQAGRWPGPDTAGSQPVGPGPERPDSAGPDPVGSDRADPGPVGPAAVLPSDPRYDYLASRGRAYGRATGRPDRIHPVRSTDDVVAAVQRAVDDGLRLTVRSGGHCFEGFVDDPLVRVVIDTALMNDVCYDPAMGAFAVEAGARLGDVYRALYIGWGVVVPAGESPEVGAGGHILGGGYGFLSRLHGLAADHLHAVEVVVVDVSGRARAVVATRAADDPHRDLWWAHTGGGGGNFGVVTRYWLRSPEATGTDPARLLPAAPRAVDSFTATWDWSELDAASFARLVRNFGDWCERHSDADTPHAGIFATFYLNARSLGQVQIVGQHLSPENGGEALVREFVAAVGAGVGAAPVLETRRQSWLGFALTSFDSEMGRIKIKDAFLRRGFDDRQIAVLLRYLTDSSTGAPFSTIALDTYGGRVNAVAEDATASAQRDSPLRTWAVIAWPEPEEDEQHLGWARALFRELFADTGGVPAPRTGADGTFVNHPDTDYADPRWNTSGIPWPTLYYKDNYPALRRVKAAWDPRNVFRHALSVEPAGDAVAPGE
ncbi:FAD-binding oxidoreductase [Nocardiopsis metallicus]|uniref:Aclacinomycin oxidase n=1 Tax=Nocardiopsis metallicus TaxID=179819 RepID=A0A840WBP4_9ACTN|nr:FAD-binding protein [Nocardiopsis metallicus]MBB5489455.1 aclacinomycin oxidase [Nocardiopsis metallicus]